jgi:protein CpxP
MLLRGITLTDAQQQRIAAIRGEQRQQMEASREQSRTAMEQARAARERGDTVAANAAFRQLRARMDQAHDREAAAIRDVLTADQRKEFDTTRAEMAERMKQRGPDDRGPRGDRRHGDRPIDR